MVGVGVHPQFNGMHTVQAGCRDVTELRSSPILLQPTADS